MKHKVSWSYMMILVCILSVYVIPDHYLEGKGIPLTSLLMGGFLVISLILYLKDNGRLKVFELIYLFLTLCCIVYQKSISPLVLLTPLVVEKCLHDQDIADIKKILLHSSLPYFALGFTIVYSIVYGMSSGRYLHTGVYEVNSSSLAVFLLGLIFMKRNKFLGEGILLFGCLSFSRNYLLALVVYFIVNYRKNRFFRKHFKSRLFNFQFLMFSTGIILYILGAICKDRYLQGYINLETSFWGRLTNFFDMSNYFRFTVCYFLIEIFNQNPKLWIVGCEVNEFRRLCRSYASQQGLLYVGNNPHHFMFSYIKLYGLAGILDVWYVGKLFKKFLTRENLGVYLGVCVYCIFLSVGAGNYWLLLVLCVMILYSDGGDSKLPPADQEEKRPPTDEEEKEVQKYGVQ